VPSGLKLNLGCGSTVVPGWVNVDKSPSIVLARHPRLRRGLASAGLLTAEQAARQNKHHHHIQPMHDQVQQMRRPRRFAERRARERQRESLQGPVVLMRVIVARVVGEPPQRLDE